MNNDNNKVTWTDKGSLNLPLIPDDLKVDPIFYALLSSYVFLELSEDNIVNPDSAIEAMEQMTFYLQKITNKEDLKKQLRDIINFGEKNNWDKDIIDFLNEFPNNYGLE